MIDIISESDIFILFLSERNSPKTRRTKTLCGERTLVRDLHKVFVATQY